MRRFSHFLVIILVVSTFSLHAKVDETIQSYHATKPLAGRIVSVGSDTMANVLNFWAEEFIKSHPSVAIDVLAEGSSTAPPALLSGRSDIAPMSRKMTTQEHQAFIHKFGYAPVELRVGLDALAIFVHSDNPLDSLSMAQVDGIFSENQACSTSKHIALWREVQRHDVYGYQRIDVYGRNKSSGSGGFFQTIALCNGKYVDNIKELPGSESVVNAISNQFTAIGFAGIGFKTAGVRAVPVRINSGKVIGTRVEDILSGEYPLSRFLYVYTHPHTSRAPEVSEFIKFMLSFEGQSTVELDGYISLPAATIAQQLRWTN